MKLGESVSEYVSRIMAIANKMRNHRENLHDITTVEKILRSMTSKFNFMICFIEESKDLDILSIDDLQNSLQVHEQKITRHESEEQALQAATISKGHGKGRWKHKNTHQRNGENKGVETQGNWKGYDAQSSTRHKSKSIDKSKVECYHCHKFGHYRSECRTNLNKYCGEISNFAENEEEEVSLLIVCNLKKETHKTYGIQIPVAAII